MQRLLFAALFLLAGCGPTNVNIPPGAVVINADTTQQQATPTPTAVAQASPTPTPAPTATPAPSACPQGWTHAGGNCLSPLYDPVTTQAAAESACANVSITLTARQGYNAAALCDTARLMNSPIQLNTYLWTSVQQFGGTPILYISAGPAAADGITWAQGVGPGQPAAVPYYCCSAPVSN